MTSSFTPTLLPALRHNRCPARHNHWVVTCVDDTAYEPLLVPFLASLIGVAKWRGSIAVFAYNLRQERVQRLRDLGIAVEQMTPRYFINLDRFVHLGAFAGRHGGIIGQWDADVWFTQSLDRLFDQYSEFHGERLVCNVDAGFQESCYGVASDKRCRQRVKHVLESIQRSFGMILQCGFVCGAAATIRRFSSYLENLIVTREFLPKWNSDTVGLNYFCYYHPDWVHVSDNCYNCLPDHNPLRIGSEFFLESRKIHALHITSPWRASPEGRFFSFKDVYPELHDQWSERLRCDSKQAFQETE